MAEWRKFTKDYDHRWPSRAVTAFKAGMIVYLKDEVVQGAGSRTIPAESPATVAGEETGRHVATGNAQESGGPKPASAKPSDPVTGLKPISGAVAGPLSGGVSANKAPDTPPDGGGG